MPEYTQLTAATQDYIRSTPKLIDGVFQRDPLLAYLKQNVREDFPGGANIREAFVYDGLIGGAYLKGKEFNISERQTDQALTFTMKYYEVNVTMGKEEAQVLNQGPMAAYSIVQSKMNNAYTTLGAHLAISLYLNGTRAGYTPQVQGLAEAINDGTNNSWDSNTYANYGTLARSTYTGLQSAPTNVAGDIEYNTLEETYGNASFGDNEFEPNLGVTTVLAYSYIKEKFQTQQRFNDTQDPKIGFNGLKFNNATLIRSRYCPGSAISGTTDPIAVTYLTQTSDGAITAYPTLTAETLFWLNARKPFINFYVARDAEFGFGFTGWKPGQGNTKVAGQVLAAVQMTLFPRYHRQLHNIQG